ncbi:putative NtrY-like two component sensor histidine kinase [Candidatus Fokinia solitaria]|uniref:Putative sensor histidine kinase NtrY-like n=1 Tax=Candidatus Fokinia solitaria TaxID=1802984 RepID=A0A2U8BRV4_9RICK|nr:ATP-binding protein [Candidatus Fokinia solitaria]AWD33084.1 putative NtrY-like two component sensor histidine kinase [Candidatus Fokinia solitaria]
MLSIASYVKNQSLRFKILLMVIGGVLTTIVLSSVLGSAYYYLGVEKYFETQIKNSIRRTTEVSQLYLNEHVKTIKVDALMASVEIEKYFTKLTIDREYGTKVLDFIANMQNLSDIMIFNAEQTILQTSWSIFTIFLDPALLREALPTVDKGEIFVYKSKVENKVHAIVKLHTQYDFLPLYVIISRYIDPEIVKHLDDTKLSTAVYEESIAHMRSIRMRVLFTFIIGSLLILFITFFVASKLSYLIIDPLSSLIKATRSIKKGDYNFILPKVKYGGELYALSKAFSSMSEKIAAQHKILIDVNNALEARKKFTETIIAEMLSGIIVLNDENEVLVCNNAARTILCIVDLAKSCSDIFPEISELLLAVRTREKSDKERMDSHYINIIRNGDTKNLLVKLCYIRENEKLENIIIALEDITEVNLVNKLKAWSEVAKRVAHEIKNPLTPIQLAIEHIEATLIDKLPEEEQRTLKKYVNIISSKIEDIKKMLMQFLSARVSKAKLIPCNIYDICNEVMILEQKANADVIYELRTTDTQINVDCDRNQIHQVMMNLLQNAANAMSSAESGRVQKRIHISITHEYEYAVISVEDNGNGILFDEIGNPAAKSKKGFGLGLSIVRSIIVEHNGVFNIANNSNGYGTIAIFKLLCSKADALGAYDNQ